MLPIKKFIWNFDYFAAVPGFRIHGEPEVNSICGGILSLLLIFFFFYIFIDNSIQMFTYKKIQAKQNIQINKNGTEKITDFMFAIGIQGYTLAQFQSYLEIDAYIAYRDYTQTTYVPFELDFCQKSQWDQVNNIDDYFQMYEMDAMMCPTESTNLTITGLGSDPQQMYVVVQVYMCIGEGYCQNVSSMLYFVDQYVKLNRYFTVNFLFLNTGFNFGERDSTFKYIDDSAWITFNDQLGTEAVVQVGSYNITTDDSFFPWKNQQSLTGHYVSSIKESVIQPSRLTDPIFAQIQIFLSRRSKVVERKFGKVDETLGYVGGLFSIVFAFFAFFAMSYNEYRYELMVAEGSFSYENGERFKDEDFNIFTYIKYSIYDWIRLLCCCWDPNWENCRRIEETREEAIEQMEVKYFMRRLAHLQNVNRLKISEAQETVLLLVEPLNIDYMKKKRMILQYYDTVMKDKLHMTILGLNVAKNVFSFGTGQKDVTSFYIPSSSQQFLGTEDLGSTLKKYDSYLESQNATLELSDEQQKTELEVAEMFFSLQKGSREKVQKKIPLLILYRLNKVNQEVIKLRKSSKQVKISPL